MARPICSTGNLANREHFFTGLEDEPCPIQPTPPTEQHSCATCVRRHPEPGLDPKMLFLLATAKLNQAERFGVRTRRDLRA